MFAIGVIADIMESKADMNLPMSAYLRFTSAFPPQRPSYAFVDLPPACAINFHVNKDMKSVAWQQQRNRNRNRIKAIFPAPIMEKSGWGVFIG